jgi:hypothetical protein
LRSRPDEFPEPVIDLSIHVRTMDMGGPVRRARRGERLFGNGKIEGIERMMSAQREAGTALPASSTGRRPAVPVSVDQIDASWLQEALAAAHPGTVLDTPRDSSIRHGTTTNIRMTLDYRPGGNPAGLPDVLWLKAGMEEHSAQLARDVGIYAREACFYQSLQHHVADFTPRCAYADASSDGRGVIMIEDLVLRGADLFHSTRPITLDDAAAVVEALAGIHRPFLGGRHLDGQDWLIAPLQTENVYWEQTVGPAYLQTWLDEPRATTYPDYARDAARLSRCLIRMAAMLPTEPAGLIHGDAHIANCYRLPDGRAGLYDWQCVGRGPGIFDIAYFLISALDTPVRRSAERDLIRAYLDALNRDGPVLSFDQAWLGYRRYAPYGFWAWLTNPTQFHPEPVNVIVSNRFANAVADLDSLGIVEAWA